MSENVLWISLAMLMFGIVHSLMAGAAPRSLIARMISPRFAGGFYRIFYNIFAGITIFPALVLMVLLPDQAVYRVNDLLAWGFNALRLLGVLGLFGALFTTDLLRFIGLRQVIVYFSGGELPLPVESFQVSGMYGLVRHPLYFFSLLLLWFSPVMTLNWLVFSVWATLYFLVGSRIEERRLIRLYGEQYREYQKSVSWMIPIPRKLDLL